MARPKGSQIKKRLSISLEPRNHAALESLAAAHDVSVAWLARRAISEFIERQEQGQQELPLLRSGSERASS